MKVQREASNAELRSSLSAATSAVSARFGTEALTRDSAVSPFACDAQQDAAGLGKDFGSHA